MYIDTTIINIFADLLYTNNMKREQSEISNLDHFDMSE